MMQKMTLLVLINLVFIFWAQAENTLNGLTVLDSKAPSELKIIINHLKSTLKDEDQILEVVNYTRLINNDLANLDKLQTLYLIKSEIYRNFLKSIHLKDKSKVEINSSLVKSVENRIKNEAYSALSKWLIKSILADLDYYVANGLLDNKDKIDRFNAKDNLLAIELDKKLNFLGPWLSALEKIPASQFEKIMTQTSVSILKSIAAKSYYFNNFSSVHGEKEKIMVFQIPEIIPNKNNPLKSSPPLNIQKEATENKEKALESVKMINPEDLSGASKEIDKLQAPKSNNWTPK